VRRYRHLMLDLGQLLPHAKKDFKLDTKSDRGVINEARPLVCAVFASDPAGAGSPESGDIGSLLPPLPETTNVPRHASVHLRTRPRARRDHGSQEAVWVPVLRVRSVGPASAHDS